MLKSIVIAVSSAVVVVATGYACLVGLIIATSMQQQISLKGYFMENTKNWELFIVYENLLSALEKSNPDSIMARFFIGVEEQIENFKEGYPEIVSEYQLKHRP